VIRTVEPGGALHGSLRVPGDKSVSHRALLLNSLTGGTARIRGLLDSEDVHATRGAVQALGVTVRADGPDWILTAPERLNEPEDVVDCGNSGTTIRLLTGLLAPLDLSVVLTGDHSLRRRPMGRVVQPLRDLGVCIDGRDHGNLAPLTLRGGTVRPGASHRLSISSAQVKTCLLLAGRKEGTSVWEPRDSRDHTERMLRAMGAPLRQAADRTWHLDPVEHLAPLDVDVPRDLSAAAFWLVGGSIVPGSDLRLPGVGLNPTRAGVVDALQRMGARIEAEPVDASGAEPVANLRVQATALRGTDIAGDLALRCLDEIPVLAVAAACAEGVTRIRDAAELRVKESDRIARVVQGLRSLGIDVEEYPDGMAIQGGAFKGPGQVDADGDHRIAMAFAMAGCITPGGVQISGAHSIGSSYPRFFDDLASLRGSA